MASPSLFRSAAGRVLRQSTLHVPSPRSPRVFFSGVAGRIESCKPCLDPNRTEGGAICRFGNALDELEAKLRVNQGLVMGMLQQEKRAQRNEQLQKKIACALVPFTAAVWIFAPNNKGKSTAEGQPDSL